MADHVVRSREEGLEEERRVVGLVVTQDQVIDGALPASGRLMTERVKEVPAKSDNNATPRSQGSNERHRHGEIFDLIASA
jgi:hypothetical protein